MLASPEQLETVSLTPSTSTFTEVVDGTRLILNKPVTSWRRDISTEEEGSDTFTLTEIVNQGWRTGALETEMKQDPLKSRPELVLRKLKPNYLHGTVGNAVDCVEAIGGVDGVAGGIEDLLSAVLNGGGGELIF